MAQVASLRARFNPWVIAMTVTLATFMEVLDTSIANVALPHIAGNLGATSDESTWVQTSYLVSNAIILPMSGWLSTRIGRKRFYMTCVVLFTLSSMLCGLATSLPMLIAVPRDAGPGRRRSRAERAGDPGRHVYARAAQHGICDLRHGDRGGARRSGRRWAAGSPTTTAGTGSSSSIFPSASSRCF